MKITIKTVKGEKFDIECIGSNLIKDIKEKISN